MAGDHRPVTLRQGFTPVKEGDLGGGTPNVDHDRVFNLFSRACARQGQRPHEAGRRPGKDRFNRPVERGFKVNTAAVGFEQIDPVQTVAVFDFLNHTDKHGLDLRNTGVKHGGGNAPGKIQPPRQAVPQRYRQQLREFGGNQFLNLQFMLEVSR